MGSIPLAWTFLEVPQEEKHCDAVMSVGFCVYRICSPIFDHGGRQGAYSGRSVPRVIVIVLIALRERLIIDPGCWRKMFVVLWKGEIEVIHGIWIINNDKGNYRVVRAVDQPKCVYSRLDGMSIQT